MTIEDKALEYSLKINGFTKEDCYNEKGELFQFIKSDMDIYLAGAKENEEQLKQAKKIINLFIQWNYGCCDIPDYKNIVKQAEQFLKEIEKWQAKKF